jgi:hypothetical protein
MTSKILKKMEEKEKKPERKSVPEKGMKRNKTTVSLNRRKIDKDEKGSNMKERKSVGPKGHGTDKKAKTLATSVRTEGNEKKGALPKSSSKKELSKSTKTLTKSKTVSTLITKKNKDITPVNKDKKKEEKKKDDKKEDKKKVEKNKEKKDDKAKKDDKKKEEKNKKDDKAKKDDKSKNKAKDEKNKKDEKDKKGNKKEEKKVEKKEEKKDEKKENKKPEEKKVEEKKEEIKTEDKSKPEEKKEEIKSEEKKEEIKSEEKKEIKPEEKKEEVKPEEKKEEIKEEVKPEEKKLEENKIEEKKEEVKPEEKKQEEKEPPKKENKLLIAKFLSNLDRYAPFLTDKELLKIASVSKKFSSSFLQKLKESINKKLTKEEKDLEAINAENTKLLNEFKLGKIAEKVFETLNNAAHLEYFKKDEKLNSSLILEFRILYQLINKEKDILKVQDDSEFLKLFRESIVKNSEKGIGEFLKNAFKNLDFSEENIYKIYCLYEGREGSLNPTIIGKKEKENPAGYINLLIKDPLDYIGINIATGKAKKSTNSEVFKKYLEYVVKKRKEDEQKLDKIITKVSS